ncbi:MAG: TIGR03936 family radical SAM-associated protein [Bacillota bacterium]|nr:TIGR03936 family radical SAM-associated protein [Bacillota bacterium]MDD3297844.1 TIGR03936 family radical SAM-associated protein [Bacillota bacterium]MDD3851050.1 TIGR03936 family radical SAM-associated protein [Bacillota bacterium]MDD4706967.1 TIGR03936 family radical SAM-associated protein [Bacillota bacterium]
MPVIRTQFFKKDTAKYISHLDLIRTMQRSVRRADIPVEYSKGFNPHSKIAYGPALAVGLSSDGEFLDMELKERMEETEFIKRLNASLPAGLGVTAAEYIPDGAPSLSVIINAAEYRITGRTETTEQNVGQRIRKFFALDDVLIERTDKRGREKKLNIMPMIVEVEKIEVADGQVVIEVIIDTGSKSNLKPTDLTGALERHTGLLLEETGIHRKRLLVRRGGGYLPPLRVYD